MYIIVQYLLYKIYKIWSQMEAQETKKKSTKINSTKPAGNSKLFHVKIL